MNQIRIFASVFLALCMAAACTADDGQQQTATLRSGLSFSVPAGVTLDQDELADREGWATTLTANGLKWEVTEQAVHPSDLAEAGLEPLLVNGTEVLAGRVGPDPDGDCVIAIPTGTGTYLNLARPASQQGCPDSLAMETFLPEITETSATDLDQETGLYGLAYGTVVGSYQGITAYSNGTNGYYSAVKSCCGVKWQCVEYANRFFYQYWGHKNLIGTGNANAYWGTAAAKSLKAYANGGLVKPKVGDMLVSNGGSYGHVAIIREVGTNYVKVIHQNWGNTTSDNSKTLTMTVSGGKYTLASFSASYPVKGWLRH